MHNNNDSDSDSNNKIPNLHHHHHHQARGGGFFWDEKPPISGSDTPPPPFVSLNEWRSVVCGYRVMNHEEGLASCTYCLGSYYYYTKREEKKKNVIFFFRACSCHLPHERFELDKGDTLSLKCSQAAWMM